MSRPIYKDGMSAVLDSTGHHGLWFERFFDRYDADYSKVHTEGASDWLNDFTGHKLGNADASARLSMQQAELTRSRGGKVAVFTVNWHMVTGMGIPHAIENGFCWHPTLGTPYLPASTVKGLIRHICESAFEYTSLEQRYNWLLEIFGSTDKDPKQKHFENRAGGVVFYDALPIAPVQLGKDIMTPHCGKWYLSGNTIESCDGTPERLPADWNDPNPIPFLTVHEASMVFCIAPRAQNSTVGKSQLDLVWEALQQGLRYNGIGAKTATGYGEMTYCRVQTEQLTKNLDRQKEKAKKARQAAASERQRLREERDEAKAAADELAAKSDIEREIEAIIGDSYKEDPLKDVIKLLDSGHWKDTEAISEVAAIVKKKWITADQWNPDYAGGNRLKKRQAKRCLKIQGLLAD